MLATEQVQVTGEATAEQTVELAELYVRLGSGSDEQHERYAGRVSELVTLALGRINEEMEGASIAMTFYLDSLRERAYRAADWMRDMAA